MKLEKTSSKKKKAKSASRSVLKGKKSESIINQLKEKQKAGNSSKDKKPHSSEKKEILLLKTQLAEIKKDYLYLKADFENYKKNVFKEKNDLIKYGGQSLVSSLAEEVLDDFDRAFQSSTNKQSLTSFRKGMSLVHAKFGKVLKNFGVTIVDPTAQPFDPQYHEALSRQRSDKIPEGHIIVVLKKAYKLYDRLIRPAQVIVSAGKSEKNKNLASSKPEKDPEDSENSPENSH